MKQGFKVPGRLALWEFGQVHLEGSLNGPIS